MTVDEARRLYGSLTQVNPASAAREGPRYVAEQGRRLR